MEHGVITIGREYGSGGRIIAQRLADELGIAYYDKELIQEVARKTGFSEHFVRETERRPTNSFLYDLYCAVQTPSASDQVFIAQAQIIKEAAEKAPCVIVGRCADYVLREKADCLRVFVHAPMAERVARARDVYGVEDKNLEAFVLRQDKSRASYYNYFATGRWGDARGYDLCVNSRIGIDQTVALIRTAAEAMMG